MKLFKSLLLASAAGMVAVSGASAADLATKKPSPVEYVRACYNPLWGTSGGFNIPGTQTCLRVGGQARFDIGYAQPYFRSIASNAANWGYRGGGNIFLDAITPSEYGNVRAFVNMSMIYRTGSQRTGSGARWGQSIDAGFNSANGVNTVSGIAAGTDFSGSSGFIQFAGFTMGRTASFYNTVGLAPSILGTQLAAGAGNLNQVAYTAVLGSGFLATVAIEDPTTRRNGIAFVSTSSAGVTSYAQLRGLPDGLNAGVPGGYANSAMPNLVAALRLDQAWGSAELSGIVSQVKTSTTTTGFPAGALYSPGTNGSFNSSTGVFTAGTATNATGFDDTAYGFSISGGLKINLPMIAAGDALFLNGTYSQGMVSSITGNWFGTGTLGQTGFGGVGTVAADGVINPYSGSLKLTTAWALNAGFQHFWTPQISTSLTGSYGEVDTGVNLTSPFTAGNGNYKIWTVGLLNTWSPVRGLAFGLDLNYIYVDPKGGPVLDVNRNNSFAGAALVTNPSASGAFLKGSDGQFNARFRVVRDF